MAWGSAGWAYEVIVTGQRALAKRVDGGARQDERDANAAGRDGGKVHAAAAAARLGAAGRVRGCTGARVRVGGARARAAARAGADHDRLPGAGRDLSARHFGADVSVPGRRGGCGVVE